MSEGSVDELKKLLLPDAKFNIDEFERTALYAMLYQEINGSRPDYGYDERLYTFDSFIMVKIKSIMQAVGSCYSHKYDDLSEADRKAVIVSEIKQQLKTYYCPQMRMTNVSDAELDKLAEDTYGHAQHWLTNLIPLEDDVKKEKDASGKEVVVHDETGAIVRDQDKIAANKKYLSAFVSNENFAHTVSEYQRLGGPEKLSIDELRKFIGAKKKQIDVTFEHYRKNQVYKPGKYDGEKGESKNGVHADHYFEAKNKLRKMNEKIRRKAWKNIMIGAVATAFAGLAVVSGGALLSYGGFALTAMFGNAFSALGVGGAVAGALGTGLGFFGAKNVYKRMADGIRENYKARQERRLFKGTKFHGKDLPGYLAEAVKKDPKDATFHELEAMYYFDVGMYEYYRSGDLSKVPKECRKYITPEVLKAYGLEKDMIKYQKVWKKMGLLDRLEGKFANVVQKVEGKGEYTMSEAESHIKAKLGEAVSIKDLEDISRFINDYRTPLTGNKADSYLLQVSEKVVGTLNNIMFENAYTSDTVGEVEKAINPTDSPIIAERLEKSGSKGFKTQINNSLAFLRHEQNRNIDGSLSPDIGVSVKNQYDLSQENIISTVVTLQGHETNRDEILSVAQKISSISTKLSSTDYMAVESEIARFSGQAKEYLKFMLKKKNDGALYSASNIETDITAALTTGTGSPTAAADISRIASEIASISREKNTDYRKDGVPQIIITSSPRKTVKQLREEIRNSSTLDDSQKEAAEKLLSEQVEFLERSERDAARRQCLDIVTASSNGDTRFAEKLKVIENITFETVKKPGDLQNIFKDNIIQGEAKEYLMSQFKSKIEEVCMQELTDPKYTTNGTDGASFEHILKFLQTVNSKQNIFIDEEQKRRITLSATELLKNSLEIRLRNKEQTYLIDISTEKKRVDYRSDLGILLSRSYSEGGLKDLFELGLPGLDEYKKRILNLKNATSVHEQLKAKIANSKLSVDDESSEARSFSILYFKNYNKMYSGKKQGDKIMEHLRILQDISTGADKNEFSINGPDCSINSFISKMNDEIGKICGDSEMTDSAKLAALLVAKKRCLAAFRLNMQNSFGIITIGTTQINVTDLDTFFTQHFSYDDGSGHIVNKLGRDIFIDNVASVWINQLIKNLDKRINDLYSGIEVQNLRNTLGDDVSLELNQSGVSFIQDAVLNKNVHSYVMADYLQRS